MIKPTRIFVLITLLLIFVSCENVTSFTQSALEISPIKIKSNLIINGTNYNNYELSGTCTTEDAEIEIIANFTIPDFNSDDEPITSADTITTKTTCHNLTWQANLNLTRVPEGNFTLTVIEAGNDPPLEIQLKKDTYLPNITISDYPSINSLNQSAYPIAGECNEAGQVSVKAASLDPVTVACTNDRWSANVDVSSLTGNQVTIVVTMTDSSGNDQWRYKQVVVTRDLVEPTVTITTANLSINSANKNNYALTGTCEGALSVEVSIGDLTKETVPCRTNQWNLSNKNVSSLPDGQDTTVILEQADSAGNVGRHETQIKKDTIDPIFSLNSSLLINLSNAQNFWLTGTCEKNNDVNLTIGSQALQTIVCSNSVWSVQIAAALNEGTHSITLTHEDVLGNRKTIRHQLIKDIVVPTLSFDFSLGINSTNMSQYRVSGTCSENGMITVIVGTLQPVLITCDGSSWQTNTMDTSTLADGLISLAATMIDPAGNIATITDNVTKSTFPRTVAINALDNIGSTNQANYPITGTCSSHVGDVTVTISNSADNTSATTTAPCNNQIWATSNFSVSGATDGTLSVVAIFGAGADQVVSDSLSITKDTTPPSVTLTPNPLPSVNAYNQNNYTLSGTCSGSMNKLTITVAGLTKQFQRNCQNPWKITIDPHTLIDKMNIAVTTTITDEFNNTTTVSSSFSKDTIKPNVTLAALTTIGPSTVLTSYALSGTCSENGRVVSVSAEDQIPSTLPTCTNNIWSTTMNISSLTDNISFIAFQADAANNLSPVAMRSHIKSAHRISSIQQKMALASEHSCLVTDTGKVKCWGDNSFGRLGNNTQTSSLTPVNVLTDASTHLNNVVAISSGEEHTCALTQTGGVKCWGKNSSGQLGNNTQTNHLTAVDVLTNTSTHLNNVVAISSGEEHTCALTQTGGVKCWGKNSSGQLGNNTQTNHLTAVDVLTDTSTYLTNITSISLGFDHSCALHSSRRMYCWGAGSSGQLGHHDQTYYNTRGDQSYGFDLPVASLVKTGSGARDLPLREIIQIATAVSYTCALTQTGGVKCWGKNSFGQLGNGGLNQIPNFFPADVVSGAAGSTALGSIAQISANSGTTCARTEDDKVKCWGLGYFGTLGNGTSPFFSYSRPSWVIAGQGSTSELKNVHTITNGHRHNCALLDDGGIKCWGSASSGQLGNKKIGDTLIYNSPVTVLGTDYHYLKVSTYQQTYGCVIGGTCSLNSINLSLASATPSPHSTQTAPQITVAGLSTGQTLTLHNDSACSTTSVGSTTSNANITLSGVSAGVHRYYYTLTANSNTSPCSLNSISYILDQTAPSSPTLSFASSSGTDITPDISVSDTPPGDFIAIYRNSATCASSTRIISVRVDGVSDTITLPALATGIHHFRAKVVDRAGNSSSCSNATTYTVNSSH